MVEEGKWIFLQEGLQLFLKTVILNDSVELQHVHVLFVCLDVYVYIHILYTVQVNHESSTPYHIVHVHIVFF